MAKKIKDNDKKTKKNIEEEKSLKLVIDTENFLENMFNIKNFFDINLEFIKDRKKLKITELETFVKTHTKKLNGKKIVAVPIDQDVRFTEMLKDIKIYEHKPLLSNSAFFILMNNFEYITKTVIRNLIIENPKCTIDKKECPIEFDELFDFDNISNLKKFIIDKYLEKMFYKSFSEQKKILLKFFNVNDSDTSLIDFELLNNATRRRNLLAHNNGIINKTFIQETGADANLLDKKLDITHDYFYKVYNEILFFGLYFIILSAIKFKNKFINIYFMGHLIYNLLKEKAYYVIKKLYESFELRNNMFCEDVILDINYFLSLKFMGNKEEMYAKISKKYTEFKLRDLKDHLRCAFAVLKDDKKEFLKILPASEFSVKDWYEFPLFNVFREDKVLEKKVLSILKKKDKKQNKK